MRSNKDKKAKIKSLTLADIFRYAIKSGKIEIKPLDKEVKEK